MPRVSVIIPTFNRARCLAEAVESVLAQDFPGFELIVVDDGSTDETPSILARYPGVTVIRTENRGVAAARNLGAARATAGRLAFLDSDDLWLPRKLGLQTAFMDERRCRICQTEETWIRGGRRVNPKKRHAKPDGDIFFRSLDLCLVSPSAVMMEKSLFTEAGGFDESLPACEDYDLWLRLGCRQPVPLLPEPLTVKRGGHPDQLSAMPGLDAFRAASLARLIASGTLSPHQATAARATLARKAAIHAAGLEKRGRFEEARLFREMCG